MTQQIINNGIVLYRLGINRDEVENISKILDLTPELKAVLTNPVIPIERRINIIEKVFSKADASDKMISFLKKMCRLGYSDSLKDIFEAYYQYWDKCNHILRAKLVSATLASDELVSDAKKLLSDKYKGYKVELEKVVDSKLIGGYKIIACNNEYDRSYYGRLSQLERKLSRR